MSNNTFLFCALLHEAKPFISHYRLQKQQTHRAFTVYRKNTVTLTVTGMGKTAMAAGVAYTLASYPCQEPVLVNMGLAGHAEHPPGSVFAIHQITDPDTQALFYPGRCRPAPCPSESLITHTHAQTDYPDSGLVDMEGAGFYSVALRFTNVDLAQCLKVVSDNHAHPVDIEKLKSQPPLTLALLPILERWLPELNRLRQTHDEPADFKTLTERCHFSHSERITLRQLLNRWQTLTEGEPLPSDVKQPNAPAILQSLHQALDALSIGL
ncbi:MAG: hypothetical protein RQ715_06295 [Methylococcales bacterium]|nr:hypothetical protein [Methylococcales bacterium]